VSTDEHGRKQVDYIGLIAPLIEALKELDKAEVLAPDSPIFPNIRGSIYTAMRDFPARTTSPQ